MKAGLSVGGIEVAVAVDRGPLEEILASRYWPFLGAVEAPVCTIRFEAAGGAPTEPNPPMATVKLRGDDLHVGHPDFEANLDLAGEGHITTVVDPHTVDHALRVLYSLLALRHDALILHACGLICGRTAEVFAGQSGAGKSTLASLAGDRPILSDEHVIVRRIDDRWLGASTPFWGSYAAPGPARLAPLGGLWRLRQAPDNAVRRVDPADSLATAFENTVLPAEDPALRVEAFAIAADLAAAVPGGELSFAPVPELWEAFDARLVA